MKTFIKIILLNAAAIISTNVLASEKNTKGVYWNNSLENRVNVLVDWCQSKASDDAIDECIDITAPDWMKNKPRIDSNDVVYVKLQSFNFIAYDVDISIEETEVETYTYLLSLWNQALNPVNSLFSASGEVAEKEIDEWRKELSRSQDDLKLIIETLTSFETPILFQTQIESVKSNVNEVSESLMVLDGLRKKADALLAEGKRKEQAFRNMIEAGIKLSNEQQNEFAKQLTYNQDINQQIAKIESEHNAHVIAAKHFVRLGKKTFNGYSKRIGKKKEGFLVDVNITSKVREEITSLATVESQDYSFDYMVKTTSPLLFHVGLIHANLDDVDYKVVRAAIGEDFFIKTKDNNYIQHFSAFMSMPIDGKPVEEANWYATLGTDFQSIGDNIYGGISYQVAKRWFVSAGVVYGLVKQVSMEADTSTSNDDSDASDSEASLPGRTLYQIADEDRETSWFISVSYQIF